MKTNASKVARQYRLQQWAEQIRECNNRSTESSLHQIVPVPAQLTTTSTSAGESFLEIKANNVCICVTESTSPELLKMVLQVTANVK